MLRSDNFKGIIGVNLGKNRDSMDPVNDYIKGIENFGPVADYLVINISRFVTSWWSTVNLYKKDRMITYGF